MIADLLCRLSIFLLLLNFFNGHLAKAISNTGTCKHQPSAVLQIGWDLTGKTFAIFSYHCFSYWHYSQDAVGK